MIYKPRFTVPNCITCPQMKCVGSGESITRYCTGFKGKKQKRIPKSGIKKRVASWCPKQISPPVCRIYGFIDKNNEMMEYLLNGSIRDNKDKMVSPSPWRYKYKCTYPLNMSAKEFYEAIHDQILLSLFPDYSFTFGEVLEIDDGHKPYYFYYAGDLTFIPVLSFDVNCIKGKGSR